MRTISAGPWTLTYNPDSYDPITITLTRGDVVHVLPPIDTFALWQLEGALPELHEVIATWEEGK